VWLPLVAVYEGPQNGRQNEKFKLKNILSIWLEKLNHLAE
jgi:hypothetical protein